MSIKTSVLFIAIMALGGGLMAQSTLNVPSPGYPTIQSALNAAQSGDTVLVAAGLYNATNLDFNGKAIKLIGSGSASCIIDAGGAGRAFVFDNGETSAARVQGFEIRNGRATNGAVGTSGSTAGKPGGNGGAILIQNSSPTIVDCRFVMNRSGNGGDAFDVALGIQGAAGGKGGDGGAIAIDGGSPVVTDCVFDGNVAGQGGNGKGKGFPTQAGLPGYGDGGAGGRGGAVALIAGTATLSGCSFVQNVGGLGGNGSASSSLGGSSGFGGVGGSGGAIAALAGTLTISASSFDQNTAGTGGSAVAAIGGTAGWGGQGGRGGAIEVGVGVTAQLDRIEMRGNKAGLGGNGGDSGAFFSIFGLAGTGGSGGLGGGLASGGATTVDRLTALDNVAGQGGVGGAGYGVVAGPGGPGGHGGAFALYDGASQITNAVMARNRSGMGGNSGPSQGGNHGGGGAGGVGGAILGAVGTLDLASSTIWDNRLGAAGLGGFNLTVPGQPGVGAGLIHASGTTRVVNSIVYANLNGGGSPSNFFVVAAGLTVEFCDVGAGWPGAGNFDVPPMLIDPVNDDFHLDPASACRDVGNSFALVLPARDLDGQLRILGNGIDVGADEYLQPIAVPGQAPRLGEAVMDINLCLNANGSNVLSGEAGPYYAITYVGGPITFSFGGEPNQPIICMWEYLNVNNVNYGPAIGQFDIGGPPDASGIPTGLTVFADGTYTYPASFAYVLDAAGLASYTYTMPFFPPGVLCAFQSAILNTSVIKMSNAVQITVP